MHHTQMLDNSCHLMTFWLLLAFPVRLPKGRECSDHRDMSVLIPEMSKSSYKWSDWYLFANALQIKLATYPALDVRASSTSLAVRKVPPFAHLPTVLGPRHWALGCSLPRRLHLSSNIHWLAQFWVPSPCCPACQALQVGHCLNNILKQQ